MALRKVYFAQSGEAQLNEWIVDKPGRVSLLDGLPDPPDRFPWLSEEDLAVFVDAFRAGGFRAPLNRYRAQRLDVAELASVRGKTIDQPACFIAGERDPVRSFVPGRDRYEDPGFACSDFRGCYIIPAVGHWVQQEAPEATNRALEAFLNGL